MGGMMPFPGRGLTWYVLEDEKERKKKGLLMVPALRNFLRQGRRHSGQVYPAGMAQLQAPVDRRMGHSTDSSGPFWRRVIDCAAGSRLQFRGRLERGNREPHQVPAWQCVYYFRRDFRSATLHLVQAPVRE